jgi:hypothetical protein
MAKRKPKLKVAKAEEPSPALQIEARGRRSSLIVIQRAVENGWDVPQRIIDQVPEIVAQIMNDGLAPVRDRLRATEVLASLVKHRVEAAIALDKIERLDGGEATERFVVSPEIEARAREIISRRLGEQG